jgi:enoyl-CoA hydratase
MKVAEVYLDRPHKANALDSASLLKLKKEFEDLRDDPELRVVVLAGKGANFCGGADTHELKALVPENAGAFVEKIHLVCKAIRELPVPVVARLHGAVIGAGLEIAAACDLRVAAEGTKFAMPEVRLGIPSVVEAALMPRLMGAGRARWLVLTGEFIDARRAFDWGLVEALGGDEAVEKLVESLLAGDRAALHAQKELCRLWEEAPLSESVPRSVAAFGRAFSGGNTISSRLKRTTN